MLVGGPACRHERGQGAAQPGKATPDGAEELVKFLSAPPPRVLDEPGAVAAGDLDQLGRKKGWGGAHGASPNVQKGRDGRQLSVAPPGGRGGACPTRGGGLSLAAGNSRCMAQMHKVLVSRFTGSISNDRHRRG